MDFPDVNIFLRVYYNMMKKKTGNYSVILSVNIRLMNMKNIIRNKTKFTLH